MNELVKNWITLGSLNDIPKRGARCVQIGDLKIAVFRTNDDKVFALEDNCPHKNGPLSQGIVHDNCVTCPLHNWVISLETGNALGADEGSATCFPVKSEKQKLFLSLEILTSAPHLKDN